MPLSLGDTIVAISTPPGAGGIGIVRLSGERSFDIARVLYHGRSDPARHPRRLCHGWIVEPGSGERVDEVLLAFMPAPHTYTREDVVEINAHGGPLAVRQVLGVCLRQGARLAEPGEMTLRAFVNGRIDLTQAEAVRDIVTARTEAALRQALGHLQGRLGDRVRKTRSTLLAALAALEAGFDFDDESALAPDVSETLRAAIRDLEGLVEGARAGIIRREGLRVAIAGKPNVGKSSLMNALLRAERAIVTAVPGTTRDTVEESTDVGGVAVVFVDTAGLAQQARDEVDRLGMERARQALRAADVALLVLDASQPLDDDDRRVAALVDEAPLALAVWNKCDLPSLEQPSPLPERPQVRLSAVTGEGLHNLEEALLAATLGTGGAAEAAPVASERQRDAVQRALDAARAALEGNAEGWPADVVALDIRAAAEALGEVTGETASDDLLAMIFSTFCVGK